MASRFPIRLCPVYCQLLQETGVLGDLAIAGRLTSIDDVQDLLYYLTRHHEIDEQHGEEVTDDLYRMCIRIRDQYYSQFRY